MRPTPRWHSGPEAKLCNCRFRWQIIGDDLGIDPVAEAAHFIGGPVSRAVAWRGMATIVGCWLLRGHGFFSVIDKATGRWAGRVGPWQPEGWPERHRVSFGEMYARQRGGGKEVAEAIDAGTRLGMEFECGDRTYALLFWPVREAG